MRISTPFPIGPRSNGLAIAGTANVNDKQHNTGTRNRFMITPFGEATELTTFGLAKKFQGIRFQLKKAILVSVGDTRP
jgi:hypothetical protein